MENQGQEVELTRRGGEVGQARQVAERALHVLPTTLLDPDQDQHRDRQAHLGRVDLGAGSEQQLRALDVVLFARGMERRVAAVSCRVDLGAGIE